MPLVPHVSSGQVIASTWGNNVADQVVMRFTTAAQRASQLTAPLVNQLTSRDDAPGRLEYWTGTAWADVAELAYAQATAPVTITNSAAASSHLVVGDSARTYDGSPVMINFFAIALTPNITAGSIMFNLFDGGTDLGYFAQVIASAPTITIPVSASRRITPTAGSHQYRITAWVPAGGTGTIQAGAGGAGVLPPAHLRITR